MEERIKEEMEEEIVCKLWTSQKKKIKACDSKSFSSLSANIIQEMAIIRR
jgi:hypothetical protein